MIYYVAALIILILDQTTKWIVVNHMELYDSISIIGQFFQITSHRNKGAAFGILQDERLFFIIITVIFVIGLLWYLEKSRKTDKKLLPFALSLLFGGALGNFIDRLLSGEVVDFFHFYIAAFDYHYPIFNIADSAIVVGVILIVYDTFLEWRLERKGASGDLERSQNKA